MKEAQIAVEEHAQVIDAIAQHCQPLETRAEGKADRLFRIETEIAHDIGMHLPRTRDFEPAALALTAGEHHVDLG